MDNPYDDGLLGAATPNRGCRSSLSRRCQAPSQPASSAGVPCARHRLQSGRVCSHRSRYGTPAQDAAPDNGGGPPGGCGLPPSVFPTGACRRPPPESPLAAPAEESSSLSTSDSRACRGCSKDQPRTPQSTAYLLQPLPGWPLHVCNCPGWLASDGPEGEDQFFRLLHERFEDIPALLFGGREHGSDDHEVVGAVLGTESTGDFLP